MLHARMSSSGGQATVPLQVQQLQAELLQERRQHQAALAEIQQLRQQWHQQQMLVQQQQEMHNLLQWPASFDERQLPAVQVDGSSAGVPTLETQGHLFPLLDTPDSSMFG